MINKDKFIIKCKQLEEKCHELISKINYDVSNIHTNSNYHEDDDTKMRQAEYRLKQQQEFERIKRENELELMKFKKEAPAKEKPTLEQIMAKSSSKIQKVEESETDKTTAKLRSLIAKGSPVKKEADLK